MKVTVIRKNLMEVTELAVQIAGDGKQAHRA